MAPGRRRRQPARARTSRRSPQRADVVQHGEPEPHCGEARALAAEPGEGLGANTLNAIQFAIWALNQEYNQITPTATSGRLQQHEHDRHRLVRIERRRRRAGRRRARRPEPDRRHRRLRAERCAARQSEPQGRARHARAGGRRTPAVRLLHLREPAAAVRRAFGQCRGEPRCVPRQLDDGDEPLRVAQGQRGAHLRDHRRPGERGARPVARLRLGPETTQLHASHYALATPRSR